jgi:hypothetical protein
MALSRQLLEAQAQVGTHINQEWARIPRVGETLEGLFRSQIFALVKTGEVKSAAIKQPGAARAGMRLIHIPSLRAWIAKHVENI